MEWNSCWLSASETINLGLDSTFEFIYSVLDFGKHYVSLKNKEIISEKSKENTKKLRKLTAGKLRAKPTKKSRSPRPKVPLIKRLFILYFEYNNKLISTTDKNPKFHRICWP